ncbi:cytochrome P450 77A2-like [Mercurialis annua]|uniref:cytochrome P450 77A2-like n=1 Tax=Mercurialis annua TaxID=3986 RepID=UPI00215E96B9|nr:cytochrome P450 77A2-like [Mercurialis annua]
MFITSNYVQQSDCRVATDFCSSHIYSSSLASYYHLFIAILTLISGLIFFFSCNTKSKLVKLPRGPPGWSIVGDLFQVACSGKHFFQFVQDLIPLYGPIFTLKMGTRMLIIITYAKLVHEALMRGDCFSQPGHAKTLRDLSSAATSLLSMHRSTDRCGGR